MIFECRFFHSKALIDLQVGKWYRIVITVKLGREQGMTTYVIGPKGVLLFILLLLLL